MQAENNIPLPEIDELMSPVGDAPSEQDRVKQFTAALIAIASFGMGLIGNLLFHDNPIGINMFLFVALYLLAAFGLLAYCRRTIVRKHAVFAVPAALCALLLGVRAAPPLIFFNMLVMLASLLIVVCFTGISRFLGGLTAGQWFKPFQHVLYTIMLGWLESLVTVLPDSSGWLLSRGKPVNNHQLAKVRSLLRGVLMALPIAAVFTVLLSSADAVFGDFVEQTVSVFLPDNADDVLEQLFLFAFFALLSLTAFWTMVKEQDEPETVSPVKLRRFRLNIIEASTILSTVNVLFVAFVVIQARYFFGGKANITEQGYTYAEYARRGFYELLVVSCMTILLLVVLETLTYRKREEENVFRALVILLVGLTFVILFAAFQRLDLYENAYGYTQIRVMSAAFMIWLGVLLGVLLIAILCHQREWFWIACIVTGLGFILTLNLMNMDGFIASRNIARFEDSGKLDVSYLLSLSDDAIPTVATLIDNDDLAPAEREQLLSGLGERLHTLDCDHEERGLFSYHIGKSRAWDVLDQHRSTLRPYVPAAQDCVRY